MKETEKEKNLFCERIEESGAAHPGNSAFQPWAECLFLPVLVSLIEPVDAAGGIHELHLARIERMGSVGNLKLHQRVLNAFDLEGLFGIGAGTGDEHRVIRHILESYKTVGFGMNSFFHFLELLS